MHALPDSNVQTDSSLQRKPANVLIISLHADPTQPSGGGEGGGTHAYLRELLRSLAFNCRYGAVVTRHASSDIPEYQRLSDFTAIHRIKLGDIAPIDKKYLNDFHEQTVKLIAEIIKSLSWKVDVLHGVYWNSGRAATDLSGMFGIPFVQTVISNGRRRLEQGYQDNAKGRIEIEKQVYAAASAIFCISEEERRDLIEMYGMDAEKLHVVGRPVPLPFCSPAQDEVGQPRPVNIQMESNYYYE